ncbi:hypothetical protein GCM10020331_059160 [Ectobacillus funiculus]
MKLVIRTVTKIATKIVIKAVIKTAIKIVAKTAAKIVIKIVAKTVTRIITNTVINTVTRIITNTVINTVTRIITNTVINTAVIVIAVVTHVKLSLNRLTMIGIRKDVIKTDYKKNGGGCAYIASPSLFPNLFRRRENMYHLKQLVGKQIDLEISGGIFLQGIFS